MYLAELSNTSKTPKLWIDCLIKPVYILMSFLRAAHENEHALQIASAETMLPYFMAAGCYHYARYGTFYVHHMCSLSSTVLKQPQHDCSLRRLPGYFNGIPTDQFIETAYMRLGHGPGGATGLAINERQMTVWAVLSFATYDEHNELVSSLHALIAGANNIINKESSTRIVADQQDRSSLRRALSPWSPTGCTREGINWRYSAPYRCPDAWLGAQRDLLKAHDCHRGNLVCPSCCLGDDTMWVYIWL